METYLDYNCPNQANLIAICRDVCIWILRIVVWGFAIRSNERLSCKINHMGKTATFVVSPMSSVRVQ